MDDPRPDVPPSGPGSRQTDRLTVGVMLALVAGIGFSLWLNQDVLDSEMDGGSDSLIAFCAMILGGLSVVGLPLLLVRRFKVPARQRRRWGPGQLLWFSQSAAAWLLWPPVILKRARASVGGQSIDPETARICYFYGTPLMAVYVLFALAAGGWLRRPRRRGIVPRSSVPPGRRRVASWSESFGLWLGLLWALLGLFVHYVIYRDELR